MPGEPSAPPSVASWCPWLAGEELAESLLTGEMSLLLLTDGEPGAEGGFKGICQEGILGIVGVEGNCFLRRLGRDGGQSEGEKSNCH